MYLVRFKRTFPNGFKKDGCYLFDNTNARNLPFKDVELYDYNHIKVFTNQPNLLLLRSGGIGDLMAYSVLHSVAKVTMVTAPKFREYLKLWETPPIFKTPIQPLFIAKSLQHLNEQLQTWGRLDNSIDEIELGSRINWYNIIYRAANQTPGELRPQIIKPYNHTTKGCLVVHNASLPNRRADFTTLSAAMRHYFNTVHNAEFMSFTTEQYIEAISTYEMVISTDTSAIHMREGFGLPAIGVYGAFDKDCRTSGYKFTKSIQSKMHCSPCQSHSKLPCKKNKGTVFSPCLEGFGLREQIRECFEDNFKNILTPHAVVKS